MRHNFLL